MQVEKKRLEKALLKIVNAYDLSLNDFPEVCDLLKDVIAQKDERVKSALHIRGDDEFRSFVREVAKTEADFCWYKIKEKFNVAEVSGLRDLEGSFRNCPFEYVDLNDFPLSEVENMSQMFRNSENLFQVIMNDADIGCVTNMSGMFYNCKNLERVYLSNLNSTKVEYTSRMFEKCRMLRVVDIDYFKPYSLKSMKYMFRNCSNLETVDFYGIDLNNKDVIMQGMFDGCESLKKLDMSGLNFGDKSDLSLLFRDCKNLSLLDLSKLELNRNTKMDEMITQETVHSDIKIVISDSGEYLMDKFKSLKGISFVDDKGLPRKSDDSLPEHLFGEDDEVQTTSFF